DVGFASANQLRDRLMDNLKQDSLEHVYACELERVRQELIHLCNLDVMQGLDIIFGASGTDMHRIASQLVLNHTSKLPLAMMVDLAESGSGVQAALEGR